MAYGNRSTPSPQQPFQGEYVLVSKRIVRRSKPGPDETTPSNMAVQAGTQAFARTEPHQATGRSKGGSGIAIAAIVIAVMAAVIAIVAIVFVATMQAPTFDYDSVKSDIMEEVSSSIDEAEKKLQESEAKSQKEELKKAQEEA